MQRQTTRYYFFRTPFLHIWGRYRYMREPTGLLVRKNAVFINRGQIPDMGNVVKFQYILNIQLYCLISVGRRFAAAVFTIDQQMLALGNGDGFRFGKCTVIINGYAGYPSHNAFYCFPSMILISSMVSILNMATLTGCLGLDRSSYTFSMVLSFF